jgi:small basic protein (TIGR04137 family)
MSQHPSLRVSDKDKKQRSVLKRHERIKILKEKEKWEEKDSVFGLPKVKITRFKIKKEKAAAAATAEGAEGAAAPGAAPATPGAAPAAGKEAAKAPAKAPAAEGKKEAKK